MAHKAHYVDGKKVPSVTTVLSRFKDPGALMHWSWKCAHTQLAECVHHLEVVTEQNHLHQIQKAKEFLATDPLETGNFRKEALEAANAGSIAHDYVEHWIQGSQNKRTCLEAYSTSDIAEKKKCTLAIANKVHKSFHAFIRWIKQSRFQLSVTEESLTSPIHRFGGTLDCVGWLGDTLILLDWKTSKRIYSDYLLQIAAYTILWNEHYDPRIDEAHVILFHKVTGDFQHFQFQDLTGPRKAFLHLVRAYEILTEIEKSL